MFRWSSRSKHGGTWKSLKVALWMWWAKHAELCTRRLHHQVPHRNWPAREDAGRQGEGYSSPSNRLVTYHGSRIKHFCIRLVRLLERTIPILWRPRWSTSTNIASIVAHLYVKMRPILSTVTRKHAKTCSPVPLFHHLTTAPDYGRIYALYTFVPLTGYQRENKYRHVNGAYSAFGEASWKSKISSGCLW